MSRVLFIAFLLLSTGISAQDFRVQLTARTEALDDAYFKERGVEKYFLSTDQLGMYRYFAGAYHTRDEAEKVEKEMKEKGFPFAYIIDLVEQRILCGAGCPYFRNGTIYVRDTSRMRQTIFFDSGRYSLNAESKATLDDIAAILKSNKKYHLDLKGYTDAVGNAKFNAQLAANRTRSARNYLIAKGIQADRMFIKVFGEADPYADNTNDDGEDMPQNRRLNRRVVLAIMDESGELKQ
jgi:outer membrane protein OmpA-like peptidoglycan-associated protein